MKKIGCARYGFKSGNIFTAALLYFLLEEPLHGYLLVERFKGIGIDPSSVPYGVVYRLLRDMEREGLISSKWKIASSGPSRRIYFITENGVEFLEKWLYGTKKNLKLLENLQFKVESAIQMRAFKREGTSMRICFTSDEQKGLESVLSYHFGHCPYYVIVDVDGNEVKKVESMPNAMAQEHDPGELPSYMKSLGIDVIITGGMGPRAQQYFEDYGIKTVTGAYGKVKDVLEEFLQSKIVVREEIEIKEEGSKSTGGENEEIERLKKENVDLRRQIADLKERLNEIEKKIGD